MKDDEIIAETRRIRTEMFAECDDSLDKLYALLKRREKKLAMQLVTPPSTRRPTAKKRRGDSIPPS